MKPQFLLFSAIFRLEIANAYTCLFVPTHRRRRGAEGKKDIKDSHGSWFFILPSPFLRLFNTENTVTAEEPFAGAFCVLTEIK